MKSLWILILSAMLLPVPVVHAGWLDTIKNTGESIGRGLGKTGDTPSGEAKQTPRGKEEKGGSPASEESVFRNFDFIPGETVIFFDDFSDTDVGEFPRKWTLKGPSGGGNPLEVVSLGDKRFLASRTAGKGIGTDRLTTTGMGDTKPLSPNDSPEGRANNRRVEFIRL
ncbi:MAG: hypothetical protein Q8O78_05425 [Candidatus Deferrimicrobium sp.]|nr:hypothetical protein [Candidatus Deferrimicrobium sp.]